MPTYNYSDGNVTLTGTSATDMLVFVDDTGTFDPGQFSYNKDNDDLVIVTSNGKTLRLQNHFITSHTGTNVSSSNGIESLSFNGGATEINLLEVNDNNLGFGQVFPADLTPIIATQVIEGSADGDILLGGTGFNSFRLYGPNQSFPGSNKGNDIIYGGDGFDQVRYASVDTTLPGINVNLQTGIVTNGFFSDQLYSIEWITGTSQDDIFYGSAADEQFDGGNGVDLAYGYGGDDFFSMPGGGTINNQNQLFGGSGNDTYGIGTNTSSQGSIIYATIFDESGDNDTAIITAQHILNYDPTPEYSLSFPNVVATDFSIQGTDLIIYTVYGQHSETTNEITPLSESYVTIKDQFVPGHSIETFSLTGIGDFSFEDLFFETLTPNNDTYTATALTSPLGLDDNIIDALAGDDTIYAGIGDDVVYGRDGDDTIYGEDGDDYITGDGGMDTLEGGAGNDTLGGGADNDTIRGGSGNDTIEGGLGNDFLRGGTGTDTLRGGNGDDYVDGDEGHDTLYGDDGADSLFGDLGDDVLYGGAGNDAVLRGDEGNDTIYGGDGNDVLQGDDSVSSDTFVGAGNDILNGEAGNDIVRGGAGDDLLYFGEGLDGLYGNAGIDTFRAYETTGQDNDMATAHGFIEGTDIVNLSDLLSGYDDTIHNLSDFVIVGQGVHSTFFVDRDGTGSSFGWDSVLRLQNNSTLETDVDQLVTDGTLIV